MAVSEFFQTYALPVVIALATVTLKGWYDARNTDKAQRAAETQNAAARESSERLARESLQAQLDLKRLEYKMDAYDELVKDVWWFHTLLRDLITMRSEGAVSWQRLAKFEEHHLIRLTTRAPRSVLTALAEYYDACNRIYDLVEGRILFLQVEEPYDTRDVWERADKAFGVLMKAIRADQFKDGFVPPLPSQEVYRVVMRETENGREIAEFFASRPPIPRRPPKPRVRPLGRVVQRPVTRTRSIAGQL